MIQPAARYGDQHVCSLCDGLKPHVGGKITGGVPKVMIGGQAAAAIGVACKCESAMVNAVATGSAKVLIGLMPAARKGDATSHGGTIVGGCNKVSIG